MNAKKVSRQTNTYHKEGIGARAGLLSLTIIVIVFYSVLNVI